MLIAMAVHLAMLMVIIVVLMGVVVIVLVGVIIVVFIVGVVVIVLMSVVVVVLIMRMIIIVFMGVVVIVFVGVVVIVLIMRMIIIVFMGVVVIVLMGVVVIVLMHVPRSSDGDDFDTSRDFHDWRVSRSAFDHLKQGFFNAAAVYENDIGFRQHRQLARSRLKCVRVGAGRDQRRQFNVIAPNVVDDIR